MRAGENIGGVANIFRDKMVGEEVVDVTASRARGGFNPKKIFRLRHQSGLRALGLV